MTVANNCPGLLQYINNLLVGLMHLVYSSLSFISLARYGFHIAPVADITISAPASRYSKKSSAVITPPTPIIVYEYPSSSRSFFNFLTISSPAHFMGAPQTPDFRRQGPPGRA